MTPEFGFCFRPIHGRGDCSGKLHLWVAGSRGETRFAPTPYDVRYDEWDAVSGTIKEGASPERQSVLSDYRKRMVRDLRLVESIVQVLESKGRGYTAADVVKAYLDGRHAEVTPNEDMMTA